MSAAANEQILFTIKTIQESAKKAENEFKIRNNEIQKNHVKALICLAVMHLIEL